MIFLLKLIKTIIWFCVLIISCIVLAVSGTILYLAPSLPSIESLRNVELQIPLRIYSADNKLIAEFGEMRRAPIHYQHIPKDFINALLTAEDDSFNEHHGVDIKGLMRAASQLAETGKIQTGGSTITMQVAKNFFLTNERSFSRKANEILLALQIEKELTKDEILELYVNKIYLGNRAYGIEAAAQVYYGKSINELSLAQMATIAGLPKAPSRYNPLVNPKRSKERRNWILKRMLMLGKINEKQYEQAINEKEIARYHVSPPELIAPYIAEMVRTEMVGRFGADAYTMGFKVYTTVPSHLQEAANSAVRDGLMEYDRRHGYRGPEAHYPDITPEHYAGTLGKHKSIGGLEPALVTAVNTDDISVVTRGHGNEKVSWPTMKWARRYLGTNSMGPLPRKPADIVRIGDIIRILRNDDGSLAFSQIPATQGALVSLDPRNGSIQALVGGFSFDQSNYNRVLQAKRQPGSSFKPFIFSAALDTGYTAASIVNDAPIVFMEAGMEKAWRPKNDNNTFLGPIRLREALYRSRNLVSIRLLQSMGIDYAISYIQNFGFSRQDLPRNLSLALGTASLTPMEIARGWSVFANGGYLITPYIIARVEDRNGQTIYTAAPVSAPEQPAAEGETPTTVPHQPLAPQVIDPRTAYIMTDILQDVIKRGTGRRALALKRSDLAGKTGTTNDSKDTWFTGYNAEYLTSVWVGFDQPVSLGKREYGANVALPVWMRYMGTVLQGKPEHVLAEPPGMMYIRIDPSTGRSLSEGSSSGYLELFKNEDAPPSVGEDEEYVSPDSPLPSEDMAPLDLF